MQRRGSLGRIDSATNPRVKAYRSLATPKGRRELGRFAVEGVSLLREALDAGLELTAAYWCPARLREEREREWVEGLAETTPLFEVSERVLTQMCSTVTPQGVAAEAPIPTTALSDVTLGEAALVVAPAETQDPGNMGAMIRTAHAVGARALVALGDCVDPYGPKVVRATMGSLFWLPVIRHCAPDEFLAWCGEHQVGVIGATVGARESLFEAGFERRTAIVLGSESRGMPKALSGSEMRGIAIPMPGGTESLNVAVAAAILMYEYRRQHPVGGRTPT